MRPYPLALALVVVASCGGQTVGTPSDAGSEETEAATGALAHDSGAGDGTVSAGSHDGGAEDGPVSDGPQDSATADQANPMDASDATPPAVGTPACEDMPCILCADGYYHCHSLLYTPCAAGISTTMNCVSDAIPSTGCFTCSSAGVGSVWECADGGWDVQFNEYACTP